MGLIAVNGSGDVLRPQLGQCSGFLIAEDIVATNSHCVPKLLKENEKSCDQFLAVKFIGFHGDGLPNIYSCEELLKFSSLDALGPDYAFFRIAPTGINPLPISQAGIDDE